MLAKGVKMRDYSPLPMEGLLFLLAAYRSHESCDRQLRWLLRTTRLLRIPLITTATLESVESIPFFEGRPIR
jgi:hypothetical protein